MNVHYVMSWPYQRVPYTCAVPALRHTDSAYETRTDRRHNRGNVPVGRKLAARLGSLRRQVVHKKLRQFERAKGKRQVFQQVDWREAAGISRHDQQGSIAEQSGALVSTVVPLLPT